MGLGDFWLQSNNGKKISLENLKELKKSDLKDNPALIHIFNTFDTQNKNGAKGADGYLSKEELTSLFNSLSKAAKSNNDDSSFDFAEAEDYINKTQNSDGQTLKQLGIKESDLFDFINTLLIKNDHLATNAQTEIASAQQTFSPEEIKDLSIQTLSDDVKKGKQIFDSRNKNQGVVSDIVNSTKETFDTEFAASRVNRYLMIEELCANLLAQSKSEEGLSEKEYLEAKINLAISMLPKLENSSLKSSIAKNILSLGLYKGFGNKTTAEQERITQDFEIELLKDALRKLNPESLTLFIQRVAGIPDSEYTEKADKIVENMINQSLQEKIRENQTLKTDSDQVSVKNSPISGSIEYIEQQNNTYRKMSFEETFEAERGVQYNQDNVMNHSLKDANMQFLLSMHNKRQEIYNILHDATVTVDSNNKLGGNNTSTIKHNEGQLESAIIQALRNLYGNDIEQMQEGLNKLGIDNLNIIQNSNKNDLLHPLRLIYDYENNDTHQPVVKTKNLNGYDLVNIANKLQNYVDTKYKTVLGNKTLEEHEQEVNNAYKIAYGARNSQHIAEAFAESQQEGFQTVKTAIQMGGMITMVAGQLIPVGGQLAASMTMGGLLTSTFGGVGISTVENFTKAGGMTEEDKKEMLKELGVSLALVGAGIGINKISNTAYMALVIKNCPKLLAFASEIGIDATMSLVADYAITGQIDLSGEGIAQLQSILVGILQAKGNIKTYIKTRSGDLTTKPRRTNLSGPIDKTTMDNFKTALSSNPLGIKYDIENFSPTEINLVNQVFDAIKHGMAPDKKGFPEGALQKLYKSGELTEQGICAICDIGGRNYMSPSDYIFFCKNKVKLTSVDSPYIIEERFYTVTHTALTTDSPSFKKQASGILNEQRAKMAQVPKEGKVVIVTGHPASGKSTATNSVIDSNMYYNVDPDPYKASFTEYNDGLGTDVVHRASGEIRNTLIEDALAQRTNLIVETTGNAERIQKQIDMFKKAGYQVEIVHINRDPKMCAAGLVDRANKTGRVVPPEILINNAIRSDYTTIPGTIKSNNPDIKVTTFTNDGSLNDFLISKKIL